MLNISEPKNKKTEVKKLISFSLLIFYFIVLTPENTISLYGPVSPLIMDLLA